jgi:DNA polymerase V
MKDRTYIAIDLKSFYASVECVERGLDPLTTHLVVADVSRTEKTICLAVSPSLKAYGVPGRARLFEAVQKVREINAGRKEKAPGHILKGRSADETELRENPQLALDYIAATPRMAYYMEYSTHIYEIYLKYIAPEDIHVYSVDEVFMDVTDYLKTYKLTPRELAMKMILDVLHQTGITATAGIGTNLYLCKIAMDIQAKHIPADENGVRIAELDEMSYRRLLWDHRPLTDFWRVGRGYASKLEEKGLFTMGDIARCSIGKPGDYYNEELLYRMFGINAELLIDHAWGWEPCRISDIKAYKPTGSSLGSGQVLQSPYPFDRAAIIVREMADQLSLDLVEKGLAADQIVLNIGYDIENLSDPKRRSKYHGAVTTDRYGRPVPVPAHGSVNLGGMTSSTKKIVDAAAGLFEKTADRNLTVRRIYVTANHVTDEGAAAEKPEAPEQLDLFTDYEAVEKKKREEQEALEREKKRQKAMIEIRKRFGKNAVLKGTDLEDGATAIARNGQIGGHKA